MQNVLCSTWRILLAWTEFDLPSVVRWLSVLFMRHVIPGDDLNYQPLIIYGTVYGLLKRSHASWFAAMLCCSWLYVKLRYVYTKVFGTVYIVFRYSSWIVGLVQVLWFFQALKQTNISSGLWQFNLWEGLQLFLALSYNDWAGWFDSRVMFIPDGESDLQVGIIYGNLGPIVMA